MSQRRHRPPRVRPAHPALRGAPLLALMLALPLPGGALEVDLDAPGYAAPLQRAPVAHLMPIDNQELYGYFGARFAEWDEAKRQLGMLFLLRYEVWPPNEGNWLINARGLDEGGVLLELVTSVVTNRGDVDVPAPLVDASHALPAETGRLLYRAWLAVLQQTRFPPAGRVPRGWRSGVSHRFAAFLKGYGWMQGQAFSEAVGGAAGLIELGQALRALLEAAPEARPDLERALQSRARALIEQAAPP